MLALVKVKCANRQYKTIKDLNMVDFRQRLPTKRHQKKPKSCDCAFDMLQPLLKPSIDFQSYLISLSTKIVIQKVCQKSVRAPPALKYRASMPRSYKRYVQRVPSAVSDGF